MPELTFDPIFTRIQLNLPVNTIGEIRAVSEIIRQIYTYLPNCRCTYSVFHSNHALLHTNQRNAFEEYYIDDQGVVIDKLAVIWIEVNLGVEDARLRSDLLIVKTVVEGEYRKVQRPLYDVFISAYPLYRIS